MTASYDSRAGAYARNRRAHECVVSELLAYAQLGPASRVLEVGCGTASHLVALINVAGGHGWGIEPSAGMRRHASNQERLEFAEGSAESIPFKADTFDLVFSVDVIHHVTDSRAYFREAKRVIASTGQICTVTDSTQMIRSRKPLSQYWPTSVGADIKRYPTVESLLEQMHQAGFVDLTTREIRAPFTFTDPTPYQERAFSCLHMISDSEFHDGLARLESDLQDGSLDGLTEYVCAWGNVS